MRYVLCNAFRRPNTAWSGSSGSSVYHFNHTVVDICCRISKDRCQTTNTHQTLGCHASSPLSVHRSCTCHRPPTGHFSNGVFSDEVGVYTVSFSCSQQRNFNSLSRMLALARQVCWSSPSKAWIGESIWPLLRDPHKEPKYPWGAERSMCSRILYEVSA